VTISKDTGSAMVFAPRVSVPLDEVIDYYGDPDYIVFTSGRTMAGTTTGLLLYWDSVNMFVELPQILDKTYVIHRKTGIERIIFLSLYDVQDVNALAGQPISDEKTAWTGYGDYQP
jgi:hypothetical protein